MPYDQCNCDKLLSCLHDAGFILRYVFDGIGYIQCVNFTKHQNPHVKEAAVIGIPDPHKGEVPKGYVVLESPGAATEHDLIAYLKEHLAAFKIPKRIVIREALPKNTSGKILKRLLVEESLKETAPEAKKDR